MKTSFLILLQTTISLSLFAQFGVVNFIDQSVPTSGVSKFESIDLNNDGFNEILVSNTGTLGRLGYYENLGNNSFSSFNLIENVGFCRGFAVGDFNNDNFYDIVSIGGTNNDVRVHMNNAGNYNASAIIDNNTMQLNDVIVADFDQDNVDDIVVIGQHSIDFYRNDGNGNFTKEEILTTSTSPNVLECLDLDFADLDNDGDIDLICGETAGMVVYLNNGNANFTPNYYSLTSEILSKIHAFDIDNDGDIDVVGQNSFNDTKWFSNDGNGVLTFEAILTSIPTLKSLSSVDYNNDGREDLYVSYLNNVSIFVNDINLSFTNEVSVYQDNNLLMGVVQSVNIDNQNGLDIVWSGGTNAIAFHLNESILSLHSPKNDTFLFYPNPTNGIIHLGDQSDQITVFNSLGAIEKISKGQSRINLTDFPSGVYTLKVEKNKNVFFRKVIKI